MNNSQRRWHYMRENSRTSCPSNFMFVDTETFRNEQGSCHFGVPHQLRLWCAIHLRLNDGKTHSRNVMHGKTSGEFWAQVDRCSSRHRPLWLWAHNVSFDMLALDFKEAIKTGPFKIRIVKEKLTQDGSWLPDEFWRGLIVMEDPPTIIEMQHELTGANLIILDTMNWWRCGLDKIGKSVGLEKHGMPINSNDDLHWLSYCKRDVEIVEKAVLSIVQLVKENDLGNLRYTAPAQGLQAYRHKFMDHKILIHNDEKSLDLERKAYFGGLCEMYRSGYVPGPIYVLDAQSHYPSIMSSCSLPNRWTSFRDDCRKKFVLDAMKHLWVIARIRFDSKTHKVPYRIGHQVQMVIGKGETVLHWPELLALEKSGATWTPLEASFYEAGYLFKRYSETLWELRKSLIESGDKAKSELVKLIMNGLAGKLGQRQINWIDRHDLINDDDWGSWRSYDCRLERTTYYRTVAGAVQHKRFRGESVKRAYVGDDLSVIGAGPVNDESNNSCPSIAGAITSWGRIVLAEWIRIAGNKNIFYADTDCVHCNVIGHDRLAKAGLIEPGKLGALQLKGIYEDAEYICPKVYRLGDEWTIAGVKKDASKIEKNHYRQTTFTGWSSLLMDGINGGLWEREQEVKIESSIQPARVDSEGWIIPTEI